MSARSGKKRRGPAAEQENEERWLLTYADMITLLMALFMVLFSIANINNSKLKDLSQSLHEAFSGKILPGGESIQQSGAESRPQRPAAQPPIPAITPLVRAATAHDATSAALREQDAFNRIKAAVDHFAKGHGL